MPHTSPLTTSRPHPASIPGPGAISSAKFLSRFFDNPITFYTDLHEQWGDIVRTKIGPIDLVMCFDLDALQQMLVPDAMNFRKGLGIRATKPLIGDGLLTLDGEKHTRERKQIQPAMQPRNISPYAGPMVSTVDHHVGRWTDGMRLDMNQEMVVATLDIAAKTMFGVTLDANGLRQFGKHVMDSNRAYKWLVTPGYRYIQHLPFPVLRRFRRGVQNIDELVKLVIASRRRGETSEIRDLLSLLLEATDDDGNYFSDKQLRDHAVTMLAAGHETTASSLTWVFTLLATEPEIQEKLATEVAAVCGNAPPTYEQLPQLPYVRATIAETMRLFPSVYSFVREPLTPYNLAGYTVNPGTDIIVPISAIHRDPRWYDDPLAIRPERFLEGPRNERHKLAYIPFGTGSRVCIGSNFAWIEMMLIVARIMQSWRVTTDDPVAALQPEAYFTMRPRAGTQLQVHRR